MPEEKDYLKEGKKNIEEGEYQSALFNLKKALEEHPNYSDINNLMAVALSLSSRYKESEEYFKKAIELDPQYIEAHINYALTLNQLGKIEEANSEFGKAESLEMERDSEFEKIEFSVRARISNAHKDTAILYASIGRFNAAIDELKKALRFAPNFHDIRTYLGEILMERGDFEEAKKELKEVLMRSKDYIPAAIKLGLCYYKEDDREIAKEIWEKAQELAPKNVTIKAHLNLLKE